MGWDGDDLVGEVEVLSTPSINILKKNYSTNKIRISSLVLVVSKKGETKFKTILN